MCINYILLLLHVHKLYNRKMSIYLIFLFSLQAASARQLEEIASFETFEPNLENVDAQHSVWHSA